MHEPKPAVVQYCYILEQLNNVSSTDLNLKTQDCLSVEARPPMYVYLVTLI